jgi:AGCS family alanine or glycine:cation symporter
MKKRLNIKLKNGKIIKTGFILGVFFAIGTILSSFGTGSLPQINSISNSIFATFGLKHIITGAILAVLLGLVIVGGIKRIAKVTSKLVPGMAIIYFIGAIFVIGTNYQEIIPSFISIFQGAFSGTAITGGFLGASFAFVFNQGVNRGLFSNEAGQGSASIAHAAARTQEPAAEGMVALLGPFIDTIIICTLTGLVLLSSGVWKEKLQNRFQNADMQVLAQVYDDGKDADKQKLSLHLSKKETLPLFTGQLNIVNGEMKNDVTFMHARSVAEDMVFYKDDEKYSGSIPVVKGVVKTDESGVIIEGKSLMHSAPLTTEAYKRSILGDSGKYIVSIGLLLFAFSTAISWSYYGDRAVIFLVGTKYVIYYRLIYVLAFFLASFVDTTIVWALSYITITLMTIPNLLGLWILHKEIKSSVKQYWVNFKRDYPEEKAPKGAL